MDWRSLQRHPLSAEYRDIAGPAWVSFCNKMKNRGFNPAKPIVLHEQMVLEGWQRLRACIETNTEPMFTTLPEGEDPRAFVEESNDERRHESQQEAQDRAEARRGRVAEARRQGESTRTIAEAENVSKTTVLNDLEKLSGQGVQTKPKGGKVTGKDGVKRPAKSKVLCRHCEHRVQVGRPVIENCPDCAELRKIINPKREKKSKPAPEAEGNPVTDDAGTVVPIRLIPVFQSLDAFKEAERLLNACSKAFKAIEEGPCKDIKPVTGSTHYTKYFGTFKAARLRLKAMRPSLVCSVCNGDACEKCQDGFLTAEMVGGNT